MIPLLIGIVVMVILGSLMLILLPKPSVPDGTLDNYRR